MADETYDVVVIGGGPGGYVHAIRAAQLGFSVACVEKREKLGGTCLNVGCIPSKALLHTSERYEEAHGHLASFGIAVEGVKLDLPQMMAHKAKVVHDNTAGVEYLFKKNKIAWIKGAGRITAPDTVQVTGPDGEKTLKAGRITIATGSDVISLPGIEIDEKRIVSSTGALELESVPKHLAVIGGGYIGLELGTVWHRLGAKVTVIEFLDRILPGMDAEVSKTMLRILKKQGLEFKLATKVTGAEQADAGVALTLEPAAGGEPEKLDADVLLVAVGRKAYTDGLGLGDIGVETDDRGRVVVDGHLQTSVPGIYALGDCIAGPMLAHKSEHEGVALAEHFAGQAAHTDHELVPGVVYTWPEAAQIGRTEEQLKEAGIAYKAGKFPFSANGRARAMGSVDGFVKVLADKETDRVLGCHIIGPEAGTLIHELAVAMEFGASSEDIARTCHAHPTLAEAVKEAALAVEDRTINL